MRCPWCMKYIARLPIPCFIYLINPLRIAAFQDMRREPEGMTMRVSLVSICKVMHDHVKGVVLPLEIEQVFGKLIAHFFFSVLHS